MAAKKPIIDFSNKSISYKEKNCVHQVLRLHPQQMTVDINILENGVKKGILKLPFAHLPKEIKKLVKPN
ncbi:MAG TPA: hypothetical protein CFH84_10335 [Sulfurimonas sp. UBA12504]|nr:MAG: hypothetical protein A2019_05980 [Sulfurimonas sp. GWF2_37_8]DAB29288.1 MAG TPA: hypothetical protein CFH84_10335 [Sulfurimonas sp. UBA12504]